MDDGVGGSAIGPRLPFHAELVLETTRPSLGLQTVIKRLQHHALETEDMLRTGVERLHVVGETLAKNDSIVGVGLKGDRTVRDARATGRHQRRNQRDGGGR